MPHLPPQNTRGIWLILLSMATFAIEDMLIKMLAGGYAGGYSVGQVLWMINILAASAFLIMIFRNGIQLWDKRYWTPVLVFRALTEAASGLLFATALAKVDISVVAAVFQATPLATTLGAALFLGETVRWRRWLAIIVGFVGVLMIVKPGGADFNPYVLLVLGTVMLISTRDLITRSMDVSVPSTVVAFQALGAVVPAGFMLMLFTGSEFVPPSAPDMMKVFIAAAGGVIGYFTLVTALRVAETGVIMPFRFSRLVFSILIGVLVFAERPDMLTVLGSGLILASGLYTFLRERKLARQAP